MMRVRLKTDITLPNRDAARFATWIEPGKEYVVLEVRGAWLTLHDPADDSEPYGLWEARWFDVTDSAMPRNWRIDSDSQGDLRLAPHRWLHPDFWSAYYDDGAEDLTWAQRTKRYKEARSTYLEELEIILADNS